MALFFLLGLTFYWTSFSSLDMFGILALPTKGGSNILKRKITFLTPAGRAYRLKFWTFISLLVFPLLVIIILVGLLVYQDRQSEFIREQNQFYRLQLQEQAVTIDHLKETNVSLGDSLRAVEEELESIKQNFERYKKEVALYDEEVVRSREQRDE